MRSLTKKRRTFRKPVGKNSPTMFQMCTEIRESIPVWRRMSINIVDMYSHLERENAHLIDQILRYIRLVMKVERITISNSDPSAHLYSFLYQNIEEQFLEQEPNAASFDMKVKLLHDNKNTYQREWVRPVLKRRINFRTMSHGELKNLLKRFRKGRKIAAQLSAEIITLNEEWEEMETQMNSWIQGCIQRIEDLLCRVQKGQGIGEE